jgi:hypothetical protein
MGMLCALFTGKTHQVAAPRRLEGELVDVEIVGESGYQEYLRELRRRRGELEIVLRPEPTNPYDLNAVVVLIEGRPVGYLPKAAAKEWQPMILAAEAEGFLVAGPAEILGGTKDKPSLGIFGSAPWPGRDAPPDRWATGRPSGPAGRPWPKT